MSDEINIFGKFPDGIIIVQGNVAIKIKSLDCAESIRDYLTDKIDAEVIREQEIRDTLSGRKSGDLNEHKNNKKAS